ncbi:nodulation protein NfeD [Mesorhizobium sp. M2D.F.Ca.ET.185.01.1.1]|uniref:NfeD family protein n=1 Tax=unclassified Mesorhizobium TaxID=325217 RepID=UPI000FCB644B|nr:MULTISPECIES: nodulation protein NfeD [unclassified Mesorhizobium]TGP80255.1 nodulation protein NfeD [bacterium M00.F.Ca.ET.227.01.1.1]TGQ00775.1 nodulation protein NfeD [bacterium M00.F.Ca.ET.221.01.1.1]TGQ02704.1 nodulation protein NfeD [bacterium M00.F.Ca.ET.222.01.1.1]TGT97858.1 nodulation protein NfeD [bacterium M00.F.Ca.ET.163.01.1.1]TGU20197.1 nodulation protein NfeD [bacterium M00.F.Ca.ET.156.01.1.1]TGU44588.1 nodulation protein NfeD [bacterium M00.F.Ca.ET.146.01.1.1]TGV72317.1 no
MSIARVALFAAALMAAAAVSPFSSAGSGRVALSVAIDGAIGPASTRQLEEAFDTAAKRDAAVLILQLDTPGGLVTSMREMIADILASPVPVIGYVAPSGGHAASAGTYILYATHVAAMAPGTNLGAATPVELGGLPALPGNEKDKDQKDATGQPEGDAMMAKVTNDSVALIRSLAEMRGRNGDWGEKAVREAASLSANAALQEHVIDFVARDTTELLQLADGRTVEVAGRKEVLATKGLPVETLEPGWFIRLLAVITDPNTAIILMLVGVYGLIFEFTSPGAVAPGVIGTICLVLGLYALNLLPINYTGLALMLLGVAFLVIEAFNPTVVLGLGGVAAFLLGSAMLLRVEGPGFAMSWAVIGPAAALTLGLALLTGTYVWAARKNPPRVGGEAMRGLPVEILDWQSGEGHVLALGERWRAKAGEPMQPGDRVEVTDLSDLVLTVRRRDAGNNGATK